MPKNYLRLGDILLKEGLITKEQLAKALEIQRKNPEQQIGVILVKSGALAEKDLTLALSKQLSIPYAVWGMDLLKPASDQGLTELVPEEFARTNHVLPLFRQANSLTVAMADPTNVVVLDNLRLITGCNVHRMIASISDIEAAITQFYGEGSLLKSAVEASYKVSDAVVVEKAAEEELSLDTIVSSAEKAPVIHLTDLLIRQAIRERASDIHIEPFFEKVSIRFRVDGVLHEISPPDKSMYLPLVSRLKIISRMDISEKRLPQDGSFTSTVDNRKIDFRVSTIPTIHGEKMVLRILDRQATLMSLETMGFEKEELETFRRYIHKPYGLILITGPTGSGKTTTLYAAINELKASDRNVTTIEDPVEYQIPGINQVNVKASIGLTFANGLRAFLRQDPDIILVGEVRDLETAQICVRAALTGHLVLSTIHTNDAPSTVNRLIDIGVEPFFVSSSLLMIVAQRLIRKLCEKCKEAYQPSAAHLPTDFKMTAKVLYRPKGCQACGKSGYYGRLPIFEIMSMNEKIEEMITQHTSNQTIRLEAQRTGMKTLVEAGYRKLNAGLTSVEEILRITLAAF